MSGGPSKMPKGIQFVKSSETLQPDSTAGKGNAGQQSIYPKPPSLFSLPSQNSVNFNSSSCGRGGSSSPSRPCFGSGAGGGNGPPEPQFGGPAVNFSAQTSNKTGMSVKYNQTFVKSGENYSSLQNNVQSKANGYRMPGTTVLTKHGKTFIHRIPKTTTATAMCSNEEYLKSWKNEKDPILAKIRKLVYQIVTLKSDRPNAMDKLHSAANRVPIRIEFNTEPEMGPKNSRTFVCSVFMEGVTIATGRGSKIKSSKGEAYEEALQKIFHPYLRVISIDPTTKELEVSSQPFTNPPRQPSKFPLQTNSASMTCQHKESNLEAAGLKRRYNEFRNLDEFVIVEPKVEIPDCTAAHTLRKSADFNHMLLEYEYFLKGESARCILKIENEVLADVNGVSKAAAKNIASAQALAHLKKFCWIIKTKQAVDSDSKISKDEIFNELSEQSDSIANDNIGNKMLRKMGWSGGGVGKDEDGIAEPVSLKSVLNRAGLGLSASKGVTDDFRRRIKEVIENYASSDNQDDLVFSCDFRLEERQIIHDECRRLNLRSKSRGKGQNRYLCVRRKRSVNQLFDHLMSVGGETTRYQLVPPGSDGAAAPKYPQLSSTSSQPHLMFDNTGGGKFMSNSPGSFSQTPAAGPASSNNNSGVGYSGRNHFNRGENKTNHFNNKRDNNNSPNVSAPWNNDNSNRLNVGSLNDQQRGFGDNNGGSGYNAGQGMDQYSQSSNSSGMSWGRNNKQQGYFPNYNAMQNNSGQSSGGSNSNYYDVGGNVGPSTGGNWFPNGQGQGQNFGNGRQFQGRGGSSASAAPRGFGNMMGNQGQSQQGFGNMGGSQGQQSVGGMNGSGAGGQGQGGMMGRGRGGGRFGSSHPYQQQRNFHGYNK